MLVHKQQGTITTNGGTISVNVTAGFNVLQQILLEPTTSSTSYDIKLVDIYDRVVYERQDEVGKMNDIDMSLPAYGNLTLTVENASADEDFDYLLNFTE